MPKHYVYRMDHDTGFAPRVARGRFTLAGCKRTTVELWARPGSWVVGIGGKGTSQPHRLIYAMRVDDNPTRRGFARAHPRAARYLCRRGLSPDAPVLLSTHFFYFGDKAPKLPPSLKNFRIDRQGAWRLNDSDIAALQRFLARYRPGKHGEPNNRNVAPSRPTHITRALAWRSNPALAPPLLNRGLARSVR